MENKLIKKEFQKFNLEQTQAQKIFDKFGLGIVETISRFAGGMVNDVYSINDQYVLKINSTQFDMPKMLKEAVIYQTLSKYNIPVPKFYGHEEKNEILEYPYILMSQLPGLSLKEIWKDLNDSQKEKLMFESGHLLASIHNISPDQLSLNEITTMEEKFTGHIGKDINSRITKIAKELRIKKVIDEQLINRIENHYLNNPIFDDITQTTLLHGNYVFGNIIISENNIQGVIDWEWAKFGNSEEELANIFYRGPGPASAVGAISSDLLEKFKHGYLSGRHLASSENFEKRYLSYALLYFLKILPSVPDWTHKPEKQKEYFDEVNSLIKQIGI